MKLCACGCGGSVPDHATWRKAHHLRKHHFGPEEYVRARGDYYLRQRHGMTGSEFDALLTRQGGCCAICGAPQSKHSGARAPKRLEVDHNHATGRIRGLLCRRCNTALGLLEDNVGRLKTAISYLENEGLS